MFKRLCSKYLIANALYSTTLDGSRDKMASSYSLEYKVRKYRSPFYKYHQLLFFASGPQVS